MTTSAAIASLRPRQWSGRTVAWVGGLFIGVIVALAAYDIVRGYGAAVDATGRELETQARVIAEQTTRAFQAVDVQLRHLAQQFREGSLSKLSPRELRAYLGEYAVGLVQIEGLLVINVDGSIRASSYMSPEQEAPINVYDRYLTRTLRDDPNAGLVISGPELSPLDRRWMFPLGRRLETRSNAYAGYIAARGKIEYFQRFYRDVRLDEGTKITLMQLDGTLLARYPEAQAALGKRFPLFDEMLASHTAGEPGPLRTVSPIDGVERFGALQAVPDYPLAVVVTRDVAVALAPWRAQSLRTAGRTLALSALAALLLAIVMRQLSRLNAARESLEISQERFALAVAGSNDGIWDFDFAAKRVFISTRARELAGMPPGPDMQSADEWNDTLLRYLHPEDVPRRNAAMDAHLAGETPIYEVEVRHRHPDGLYRWVRVRGVCVRDAAGKPLRMAGSISDIDARRRAESERVELEGQLLQAKKLEAIGTLAGGIAHDFNNILSAILGYGEMAQKDAAEGTALRRHVDAAMSAGMRAKSLVERILAFSRSGIGERAPVHVQSVVAEALDLVEASLPPQVRLERRLAAGDAAVMGDPTQIHQVVMNLCTNGVQAMKGKGVLTVALDLVEKSGSMAATSALSGGSYVRLSVRDTGAGIAASVLERIFDPFFTTKEVGVGTGLGLSLVHGIVTDLGGGIDVESRPGEGAAFTVYLPRSGSAAASANIEEVVPNGAGETVLLVDDEETLVRLGEEMIAGLGYEPVGFASAAEALQTFRASPERFDAVLSDEAMPDMTGSELAKEIRAIRPDLPIVLMSGFVSPALLARARELGVMEVLAKPLVARDIARGLANALRSGGRP